MSTTYYRLNTEASTSVTQAQLPAFPHGWISRYNPETGNYYKTERRCTSLNCEHHTVYAAQRRAHAVAEEARTAKEQGSEIFMLTVRNLNTPQEAHNRAREALNSVRRSYPSARYLYAVEEHRATDLHHFHALIIAPRNLRAEKVIKSAGIEDAHIIRAKTSADAERIARYVVKGLNQDHEKAISLNTQEGQRVRRAFQHSKLFFSGGWKVAASKSAAAYYSEDIQESRAALDIQESRRLQERAAERVRVSRLAKLRSRIRGTEPNPLKPFSDIIEANHSTTVLIYTSFKSPATPHAVETIENGNTNPSGLRVTRARAPP